MQRKNILLSTIVLTSLISVNIGLAMNQDNIGKGVLMMGAGRTVSYIAHRNTNWSKNTCLLAGGATGFLGGVAMQGQTLNLQDFAGQLCTYIVATALSTLIVPVEERPTKETASERCEKGRHGDLSVPSLLDSTKYSYNR